MQLDKKLIMSIDEIEQLLLDHVDEHFPNEEPIGIQWVGGESELSLDETITVKEVVFTQEVADV